MHHNLAALMSATGRSEESFYHMEKTYEYVVERRWEVARNGGNVLWVVYVCACVCVCCVRLYSAAASAALLLPHILLLTRSHPSSLFLTTGTVRRTAIQTST